MQMWGRGRPRARTDTRARAHALTHARTGFGNPFATTPFVLVVSVVGYVYTLKKKAHPPFLGCRFAAAVTFAALDR